MADETELEKEPLSEERRQEIRQGLKRFKMLLMKNMPFYGDIVMRIPVLEDESIETACTNGLIIRYNPHFLDTLTEGQRNYVLMHEVMHILLRHVGRRGARRRKLWNIATDIMVNNILDLMKADMPKNMLFERPEKVLFADFSCYRLTAEFIYCKLVKENPDPLEKKIRVLKRVVEQILSDLEDEDPQIRKAAEEFAVKLLEEAGKYAREKDKYYIPESLLEQGIREAKPLPWNRLLQNFLSERQDEESSYMSPERKYIHMDMIVPGCGIRDDELGSIWAFVDSSGSIDTKEMQQFLIQLYFIAKEFHCRLNIAFWNDTVSEVYCDVRSADQIKKGFLYSNGGTDINCVYQYIRENKIKPEVMLILTDGFFGNLTERSEHLRNRTICVISEEGCRPDRNNRIGKIACL